MKTLELKTSYDAEIVAKVLPNAALKITIYDDCHINPVFLESDQALKLAHFILENVK